jgi:ABC-2 type transport system permease protein
MTTAVSSPAATGAAPAFGRLLKVEMRRLMLRRFTVVLLGLSALGYLAAMVFLWTQYARPTDADYATAAQARDQVIASSREYVEQCIAGGGAVEMCGFVPTADSLPIDTFLPVRAFSPAQLPDLALAVGAAVAVAGFVLGATFIGAEWSSRNLVAWLFYEPRRLRLLGAKLLALTGTVVVLAVLAQVIWLLTGVLLISQRGEPVSTLDNAATFWGDTTGVLVRAALLVVPATWLGFGLANLLRNTASAFGVAFVFFVIVESVMRGISPGWQPYQFTTSVAAWVTDGGITVYGDLAYDQRFNGMAPQEIPVSNLHGGIVLLVYALVVLGASVWMFRRRDIT